MAVQALPGLAGQGAVGQFVTVPWWPGAQEVTQGWGATDYDGEPEGHGYQHWHAGVDIGCDCGTVISLPHGISATARYLDNPGGYGVALRLEQPNGADVDILLGHLRQRLVSDGQQLRGGEQLAVSNNTGNSNGCHVHFETRPHGGRYGTDFDPSGWLLAPEGATGPGGDLVPFSASQPANDQNPYNPLDPRHEFWDLEHGLGIVAENTVTGALAVGQVGLGTALMLGGLAAVAFGLRGGSPDELQRRALRAARGLRGRQRPRAATAPEVGDEARQRALRAETLRKYQLGLISRKVAQERLGEAVRGTGPRARHRAYGEGVTGPGIYRKGRRVIEMGPAPGRAHVSRVRPNLRPALEKQIVAAGPPRGAQPRPGAGPEPPIPF